MFTSPTKEVKSAWQIHHPRHLPSQEGIMTHFLEFCFNFYLCLMCNKRTLRVSGPGCSSLTRAKHGTNVINGAGHSLAPLERPLEGSSSNPWIRGDRECQVFGIRFLEMFSQKLVVPAAMLV